MSHRFGWCLDGAHGRCRQEIVKVGTTPTETVVLTCSCNCHTQREETA